jgi:hypothetical protein
MKQDQDKKQYLIENLIYLIIWLFVLIIPLFISNDQSTIDWENATSYWKTIAPFFTLFLLNNYVLAPWLLNRKKLYLYLLFIFVTIFLFFTAEPLIRNKGRLGPSFPMDTMRPARPLPSDDFYIWEEFLMSPPDQFPGPKPPGGKGPVGLLPLRVAPMVNNWLTAILIVGSNLAIKFLFKSMRDDRQLKELEKHNLQTELNYLKAQINPHFFMNTLNNIHALIDLNAEKAKDVVIELSRLMRYVLYDSSYPYVSLKKEVEFLYNYVGLMKIRYTDDVDIQISVPDIIPDVKIPPLLFMTFIENAFKHGISYQNDSYIYAVVGIDDEKLSFMVENSSYSNVFQQHGVGLDNIKKRLQLLYQDDFTLHIEDTTEKYKVILTVPITS